MRPNLHEARGSEVSVVCERLRQPTPMHKREAHGIDKGVLALTVSAQPSPRLLLQRRVDMREGDARGLLQSIENADSRLLPRSPSQEGLSFPDHVVAAKK